MKFFIAALIIINLIFLDILISNMSKIRFLDDNIKQQIASEKNQYFKKNKEKNENEKTLDTFFVFIRNVAPNINFKNIYIENKNVSIEVESESFDYITFVDELEKKNEFVIKSLITSNEFINKNFNANLELK